MAGSTAMFTDKFIGAVAEFIPGSRETQGGFFDFDDLLQNTQDSSGGALLAVWESI